MLEASIWKINPTTYKLQIQFKNKKDLAQLQEMLKDWSLIATGFKKTGDFLNIFTKQFDDPKSWLMFAKTLPLKLVECDKDGNKKAVKTAISIRKKKETKLKTPKQGTRTCGKCGKKGHNTRTCK